MSGNLDQEAQDTGEGLGSKETDEQAKANQENSKKVDETIDHGADEVIENDDPEQAEYKATSTVHRAETPDFDADEVTPSAPYTQQEQNSPQPGLHHVDVQPDGSDKAEE